MLPKNTTSAFIKLKLCWKVAGLYPFFGISQRLHNILLSVISIVVYVMLPISYLVNAIIVQKYNMDVIKNLVVGLATSTAAMKFLVIYMHKKNLEEIDKSLVKLDARCETQEEKRILIAAITLSQKMIKVAFFIFMCILINFQIAIVAGNQTVYIFGIAIEWKNSNVLYIFGYFYQVVLLAPIVVQNVGCACYAPIYLSIIKAHMQTLGKRVLRVGMEQSKTTEQNYKDLTRCIQDHQIILKIFHNISCVISQTLIIQIILTGVVLCMSVNYFLVFSDGLFGAIYALSYSISTIIEVLPCCLAVSDLIDENDKLRFAIFSCNWPDQDKKFRKSIILFLQGTQAHLMIRAGSSIPISLETFISLIKFTYTLFTIVRQM